MSFPFLNIEKVFAFLMTKENAASLTGDLEERFERIGRQNGQFRARLWFVMAFVVSLPPLLVAFAERPEEQRRAAAAVALLLKPGVLMMMVLALWGIGSDQHWTNPFTFRSGVFSHWQVWLGLGTFAQLSSSALN